MWLGLNSDLRNEFLGPKIPGNPSNFIDLSRFLTILAVRQNCPQMQRFIFGVLKIEDTDQ